MPKVTILLLYIRLFGSRRWLRNTCYASLVPLTLVYWTSPVLAGAYNTPRNGGSWTLEVVLRAETLSILGPIYGAFTLAADILLLGLPLPIVCRLNLEKRRKLGLCTVFVAGVL